MFPSGNQSFTPGNAQNNNPNNINLAAALYLHPSLAINNSAYSQLYQQTQGQAAQLQLQRQLEQLVVAQAQNAQLHVLQQRQQQAIQNQQAQVQLQAHNIEQQLQAGQIHRLSLLRHQVRQQNVQNKSTVVGPKSSRQNADSHPSDADVRRRRSLIADFAIASTSNVSEDCAIHPNSASGVNPYEVQCVMPSVVAQVNEITEKKKNSITDKLESVEKEKKLVENQLTLLQRKKDYYESEIVKKGDGVDDSEKENDDAVDEHRADTSSLIERIHAENRKKAARAEAQMPPLLTPTSAVLPQCRNPWDSPLVRETMERYKLVKPVLVQMLTERHKQEILSQKLHLESYNRMYAEWLKKDERYLKSHKKIARDEKHREIFEKTFPEVKKSREERERRARCNQGTDEQEQDSEEYKKRRAAASMPPAMLSRKQREAPYYVDLNGVVTNALESRSAHIELFLSTWGEHERLTFKDQIVAYGKNFAAIAEFLPRKTVKDCVFYYYLTKKRQNYKALIGKKRKKPPRCYRPPMMPRMEDLASKATQDARAVSIIGSREFECWVCKATVNSGSNMGRIDGDPSSAADGLDVRFCENCKAKGIKPKVATRCQIGACHNIRRKVKPTRPLPPNWKSMTTEQKEFLMHMMIIPPNVLKCCPACHKKISKNIDMLISGELEQKFADWRKLALLSWTGDEIEALKAVVETVGTNAWNAVAQRLECGNRKFSPEQCRLQFEKLSCEAEAVTKDNESDFDEGSDDERDHAQQQARTTVMKLRSEHTEAEPYPSGESSATLSADEGTNQEDCIILSPIITRSPSFIYKPRFRLSSMQPPSATASPSSSDTTAPLHVIDIIKPGVAQVADVEVIQSTSPKSCTIFTHPVTVDTDSDVSLTGTLPNVTSDQNQELATYVNEQTQQQRSRSAGKEATPSGQQNLLHSIPCEQRTPSSGSIMHGTPMARAPSTPNYDSLMDKIKQAQLLSVSSLGVQSDPATSSAPFTTLTAPNPTENAAAAAMSFLQPNQIQSLGSNFSNLASEDISPLAAAAAIYNQFASMDPAGLQYTLMVKLMQQAAQQQQQEMERARLSMLRGNSLIDQYRQQSFPLVGLCESPQVNQQQLGCAASLNDQAKILLWQQLLQQASGQNQPCTPSGNMNLQRNTPVSASFLSAPSTVRQPVALNTQQHIVEHPKYDLPLVIVNNAQQGGSGDVHRQPASVTSIAASQIYNDFRNAEQMRKEKDEKTVDLNQKRIEDIKCLEQLRRSVIEQETQISEELDHLSNYEYPRAVLAQDGEAAHAHFQEIERLKERRTAINHYFHAYDERLKSLGVSSASNSGSSSNSTGVIIRGTIDDRPASLGLVSKGAMKEFPPSVSKASTTNEGLIAANTNQSLIGIKRNVNDSTFAAKKVLHQQHHSVGQIACGIEATSVHSQNSNTRNTRVCSDSQYNAAAYQQKYFDKTAFDTSQAPQSLRAHGSKISEEEFSRSNRRTNPASSELKRKSGIHTVFLPPIPDSHHHPSIKAMPGMQKRIASPSRCGPITSDCALFSSLAPQNIAVPISCTSPNLMLNLPNPSLYLSSHSSAISPNTLQSGPNSERAADSSSSPAFGSRRVSSTLASPRLRPSMNPDFQSFYSANASPHSINPYDDDDGTNSPLKFNSPARTQPAATISPRIFQSSLATTDCFSLASPSLLLTTSVSAEIPQKLAQFETEIAGTKCETPQSSVGTAANYEPLSPDTSDESLDDKFSSLPSAGNPDQSCLPLFSLLNLPDNGISNTTEVSSTEINQVSKCQDLANTSRTQASDAINALPKPPPPTYEPLSDDE